MSIEWCTTPAQKKRETKLKADLKQLSAQRKSLGADGYLQQRIALLTAYGEWQKADTAQREAAQ